MAKLNNKKIEDLFKVILALKNLSEAKRFFRDLLTEPEIIEFSRRWQVVQMLAKKTPYSKIESKTGLSSTTVARVAKWLNNGKGGYKIMLKRINKIDVRHHNSSSFKKGLC